MRGKKSMKKEYLIMLQVTLAAVSAFFSDKLGLLFPVLKLLIVAMVIDYFTGMAASKTESLEHPEDASYGWNSKKGAKGILKKTGYLCVIVVAMMADYIILHTAKLIGLPVPTTVFFGLLVTVWYLLNELLSITENAGRMGAPVPDWLCQYIAVLKGKIDENGQHSSENPTK